MIIPITGVPFCKQSRFNRIFKIDRSEKHTIIVEMETRTLDVPYGDHFYQAERWTICTVAPPTSSPVGVVPVKLIVHS